MSMLVLIVSDTKLILYSPDVQYGVMLSLSIPPEADHHVARQPQSRSYLPVTLRQAQGDDKP
jgi:hypothetical protein